MNSRGIDSIVTRAETSFLTINNDHSSYSCESSKNHRVLERSQDECENVDCENFSFKRMKIFLAIFLFYEYKMSRIFRKRRVERAALVNDDSLNRERDSPEAMEAKTDVLSETSTFLSLPSRYDLDVNRERLNTKRSNDPP